MEDLLDRERLRPRRPLRFGGAPERPAASAAARETLLRVVTINTHRGQGPKLNYLLQHSLPEESERLQVLHSARAYAYFIAEWLYRNRRRFDVVALQEVFTGIFGLSDRILRRFRQHRHYRAISRFPAAISHGVGFAGFRYENLLLSRLAPAERAHRNVLLPGRIGFLAACGFTLAPFRFEGREIWIGNTHLHSFNPRARARQAESIAAEIKKLGDVPVVFLGDLNTVPPGCRETGFPAGERDARSYKNDRTLAILTDAGLVTIPHEDRRRFYTYPTGVPNRTLDYVLHSRHFEVVSYRVIRTFRLSDHYPVRAELRLR